MPTPRVPATQAVGDGRDRPASILIPVVCCMLRWMLLGSRVGLGIVMCPLWRSAFGFACLFLFSHVFTGHRALGRLGRHCLARQFSRPKRYASCLSAYSLHGHLYGHTCHSSCFTRVAHMCHDMTGKRCDPESGSESLFFFLGYRGIVHPPSADEGTERIWFEPEQRPRKRVPKRSVHGKQSPQGASKMSWRQDDQP